MLRGTFGVVTLASYRSRLPANQGVGACRIRVVPGEGEAWITGTYDDPAGTLPLRVAQEGGTVRITTGQDMANVFGLLSGVPRLDLALGKGRPYAMTLEAGATDSSFDLGGLPITQLAIKQGAGKNESDFSAPNPESMSLLTLGAGAVSTEVRNLANANFAELRVDGGAASYKLDFGGALRQSASVRISTGMSAVEIVIPAATAAKITSESLLGGLSVGDGFMKKEGAFWTEAALAGKTPLLTVRTSVALGSLSSRAS